MFFIQVVRGRPGGRLQFSGGGSKMAWLASAFSSVRARCPKKVRRRWLVGSATDVVPENIFVGGTGQLSLASLRGRLIEYQLRLG